MGAPGLRVRVEAEPDLPPVLADRGELETVLVNLAANARDAMPGGGTLTLAAAAVTVSEGVAAPHPAGLRPGRYVRLSAADTGAGMDAETLARAAEPFFTTKPEGEGTGLGLAMAREFAERAGGGFAVASEPGLGTTVTLWLPVAGAAASPGVGPAG
jgi:signal transduction histidine kinase